MEIKQYLPNYVNKYLDKKDWEVCETAHYVFHYFENSVAKKDIEKIKKRQEQAFSKIINFLEIKEPNIKIKYYFYPTEKDKEKMMGGDGFAQVVFHDNSIHSIYTEDVKPIGEHEDTHILSLPLGRAIGFFEEGLAEYLHGCVWGKDKTPSEKFVKEALKNNEVESVEDFFSQKFWMENYKDYYYPLAGTFTKFLIEKFGKEKHKKLYSNLKRENSREKNIKIFEEIFGDLNNIADNYFHVVTIT